MGKIAEALLAGEEENLERSCRASAQGENDLMWGPSKGQRTRDAYSAAPRFVLLNFRCATALAPGWNLGRSASMGRAMICVQVGSGTACDAAADPGSCSGAIHMRL